MKKYQRVADALHSDLGDETVLLHMGSGTYYGVEGVGGRIWQALSEPRSEEELVKAIMAEFEVDEPTCRRDVKAFLADLQSEGLVEAK
ncbi:MAG: PqqD family peptide modification chaperone [Thermoplasmatota archaeon]